MISFLPFVPELNQFSPVFRYQQYKGGQECQIIRFPGIMPQIEQEGKVILWLIAVYAIGQLILPSESCSA